MSQPGYSVYTIQSVVAEVLIRMENQPQSVIPRAAVWVRDTLMELTTSPGLRNEFDELTARGPQVNLIVGQQEYPEAFLLTTQVYEVAFCDIVLWTDYPTNDTQFQLQYVKYQEVDKYQLQPGPPFQWYRRGTNIGFNSPPDQPYQVQVTAYLFHPGLSVNINTNTLLQQQVFINQNWFETLVWGAVVRGYMEKQEFDKANEVIKLLHGDPEMPSRPGIVSGMVKRPEMEAWRQDVPLRPLIRPYC